jgi:hypothetical protein
MKPVLMLGAWRQLRGSRGGRALSVPVAHLWSDSTQLTQVRPEEESALLRA